MHQFGFDQRQCNMSTRTPRKEQNMWRQFSMNSNMTDFRTSASEGLRFISVSDNMPTCSVILCRDSRTCRPVSKNGGRFPPRRGICVGIHQLDKWNVVAKKSFALRQVQRVGYRQEEDGHQSMSSLPKNMTLGRIEVQTGWHPTCQTEAEKDSGEHKRFHLVSILRTSQDGCGFGKNIRDVIYALRSSKAQQLVTSTVNLMFANGTQMGSHRPIWWGLMKEFSTSYAIGLKQKMRAGLDQNPGAVLSERALQWRSFCSAASALESMQLELLATGDASRPVY
ncbi:hypothetical protein DFH09DRAFT_1407113 [Mycena vulgaris]|nr:hypothetical protein DFH09DRAFT_1407113 [Mycena vulgaris]